MGWGIVRALGRTEENWIRMHCLHMWSCKRISKIFCLQTFHQTALSASVSLWLFFLTKLLLGYLLPYMLQCPSPQFTFLYNPCITWSYTASRLTKLRIISWHYTWLIFQLHWLSKGNFWLLFKSTSKQRKHMHSSLQGFKLKQSSLPRPFSEEIGSIYTHHNHSCHAPSYLLPYRQKAADWYLSPFKSFSFLTVLSSKMKHAVYDRAAVLCLPEVIYVTKG